MKKFILACLLFILGGSKIVSAQCLSGNYTIGPIGANYTSFTTAINDLVANGICGPVEFLVAEETYNEQLTIPYIQGVSDVSRIVFKSNPSNINKPIVINSPAFTNPYLLLLDSANYITFDGLWLSYGDPGVSIPNESATVLLRNSASHNTITNCTLYAAGPIGGSLVWSHEWYPSTSSFSDNELSNSEILLGNLKFRGDLIGSGGTRIKRNFFGEGSKIALETMNSFVISDNTFQNVIPASSGYAIDINNCDSLSIITRNKFEGPWSGAISVANSYTSSSILISNNMISCGGSVAIRGINIFNVNNAKIYNNNVGIYSALSSFDAAFYMQGSTNVDLVNNIFSNFAGNLVMYITGGFNTFNSDYNDLFSTGSSLLSFNGTSFANLTLWKANIGNRDQHSFSFDPIFTNSTNLHVHHPFLKNNALALTDIVDDFDLEPRNSRPDIGADEFSALTDSVWPGDANDDGICDASDLIPIGMYFNEQGPGRVPFSNSWVAYKAQMWNVQVPNFNDAKFADCNGDGIVNLNDTLAFTINGGNTHPLRTRAFASLSNKMAYVNFQLDTINSGSILDASLEFDQFVGGLQDSIYSFSFSSLLSPSIVLSNSLYVDQYIPSWGNYATDYLTRNSLNLNSNKFSISATAINHQNNTSDQIHFHFGFNVINSTGVGFWYKIPVVDFKVYDRLGNILDYNLVSDSVYITTITSIEENNVQMSSIYTHENNKLTFISSVNKFQLFDVAGRLIFEKSNLKIGDKIQIPSSNSNLYVTLIEKNATIFRDKIFVEGDH